MTKESNTRRQFLGLTGAGIAAISTTSALTGRSIAASSDPQKADLVVINAKVYTVDAQMPRAQAFAVKNGRFMAVGASDDIKGLAGAGTEIFDAKGMTVVPGFIDCHSHAEAAGKTFRYGVIIANPLTPTQFTIASVIDKLRDEASKMPPGFWVVGSWYDDTKAKDKRSLNVHDLDKVSTELPVVVHHVGGHTTYYNSKAFELAGITKNTPNPPGGTFDRDANGNLNGRVSDNAMRLMDKAGKLPTYTPDQELERGREGVVTISKEFVSVGLTSVAHQGGNLAALQQARERGELLHRVNYESSGDVLDGFIAAGIRTGFGDDRIRIGSTSEHTVDGSFEERTMSRATPYPAASNPLGGAGASDPPYYGNITVTQDDLNAWAERVHRAGIACNCHANGDPAIAMVLTAYERAQKLYPRPDVRHHITHCTHITDDIVRRIKALGVVPNSFTTYLYADSEKFHYYDDEFLSHCMAFRTWIDAGIPVATGTDSPPDPNDPRIGIQGMVTRMGWDGESWGLSQRISVDEALKINTLNGAYYMHEEAIKGSITPGKVADFVAMADDMHTVDPNKIKDIQIVRTVVGGATVYQA